MVEATDYRQQRNLLFPYAVLYKMLTNIVRVFTTWGHCLTIALLSTSPSFVQIGKLRYVVNEFAQGYLASKQHSQDLNPHIWPQKSHIQRVCSSSSPSHLWPLWNNLVIAIWKKVIRIANVRMPLIFFFLSIKNTIIRRYLMKQLNIESWPWSKYIFILGYSLMFLGDLKWL